jgi:hypothetical protein
MAAGGYELAKEAVVKPVVVGAGYQLGLASSEEAQKALTGVKPAVRSAVSGVASDIEDTANLATRAFMFGTSFTDKLQGLSADERFKRYRLREDMRNVEQAWREQTPDRAAALLAENPILKKMAGVAAKMQGATEEEAKEAEKAYSELVLESGLTKDELNQNISAFGEFLSPLSIPGANLPTKTIGKYTGKAVQKGGELALKGVVKPLAIGVEKTAGLTEKGIAGVQTGISKLGEYITGDPDTLLRGGSIAGLISAPQITATILAAKPAAIATKEVARTVKDIASQVDVGGAAGRRGLFERAGRAAESSTLTKKLFSPEARGGLGRAKTADWITRQSNAIVQQGVNGSVLNTMLGLPDIESAEQLGQVAGSGFGIGALAGSRLMERTGAIIDPRTGLAQKIDTIITPDPNAIRADEDADIKRFLSSVDPELVPKMEKLGNIDERKKAIQSKIDNLEKQKDITFGPEVELIKERIENQKKQLEALNKSTPETQKEVLRQVHLAFADEMDLAKTTGKAAGLNNIQVKILDPSEMEGFFRNAYGATLTDAESVVANLTGKTDLSPQESENLVNARKIVDRFFNEVAGAQSARGLAISESNDLDGSETPAFMRKQNLQGATIVINSDLVKQLSDEGFNIRNVVGHEMQHALNQFTEVRDMIAPIRRELFDQNIVNEDGTINKVTQGIYSDDKLDEFANRYAAAMSPSDNGESFKAQFADQNKLRAYIKEEILSEIVGRSGNVSGGTRAGLDSIGRQVVDWIEVSTQNGALKAIKETLRKGGIIVDDSGDISTILGAELTPESLAMIRQYQRQLKNLNQSMVYEDDARKEEIEIPVTKILSDRSLQQKFKNSDIFEKEQVATMTAPDGSKQEILLPPDAGVDPFVGTYQIQGGQLVDENGTPMNLGPQITFGTMPDGTRVEVGTRIARNVDGSPKILSNREVEARSRNRGKIIRNAIDSALSKGALQLEDTGNGNYRGVMSESQVNAVLALPNTIVSPNLKRQILFVNEILRKKDGTRMWMEYQATMRGGKARALSPQIRDEIPIGFQFSKQGNFLITTMSVSRMHDKMNAWLAKKPENLKLWNGDTTEFWNDVIKVLDNHSKGQVGQTGLDPDPAVAIEKKNAVNDLFNVWNADTKAANPRRTKLPVQKGKDPIDVIVRSRRIDRINQYNESALQKMPFNYELNTQNYMPAENPLAGFQTPEDFSNELPSVTAEEIRSAINTGNLDQLESKLRESDDLKPAESLDEQNGNIRIVSMFDAEFMPEESLDFVDSKTQFMPAEIEAPSGERGFQSKLQIEIQRNFKGAKATPEQLKAVLNNPQNVKAEEVKWSGVNDAIDRLASENNGKVPVQELLNYLRDEGQVKFEEVTLGGKEPFDANRLAELEAEYKNLKDHPIDDPSFGEEKYDELIRLMNIRDQSTTDTLYEEAERVINLAQQAQRRGDKKTAEKYFKENEFLNTRAEKLDLQGEGLTKPPKFGKYQLSGGENYREVVMAMPYDLSRSQAKIDAINKRRKEILNISKEQDLFKRSQTDPDAKALNDALTAEFVDLGKQADQLNADIRDGKTGEQYTSSHFSDIPNYVAHMRLNERTDAEGNNGLFIEELQSDRHQAGRERGYEGDIKPISAEENKRLSQLTRELFELEYNGIDESNPTQEFIELNREYTELSNRSEKYIKSNVPDAPFRKDWSLQLFKRALRDAVESGKQWIGWTTGDTQAERYDLSKQIDRIDYSVDEDGLFSASAIKGKSEVFSKEGMEIPEVEATFGKEIAEKMQSNKGKKKENDDRIEFRSLAGLDLKVGGEGMKGFYDTILPKELGKYVSKMGGKVVKSNIIDSESSNINDEAYDTRPQRDNLDLWEVIDNRRKVVRGGFSTLDEAESFIVTLTKPTTPIWRVNITPQMENVVRAGQLQFMPAEQTINKVPTQEELDAMKALLPKYTSKLRNINKNVKYITVYDENGREAGDAEIYVNKRDNFISIEWIDTTLQKNKGFGQALYREIAKYAQQQNIDTIEGEIINKKAVKRREELFETISKSEGTLEGDYDEDPNKGYYADLTSKVPSDIRFMPAEQGAEPEGLQNIELPTQYRRISDMIPPLRDIEPPVRAKAMLPDMELEPTIGEKLQSPPMIGANTSEKPIQSSDIITSAKPAPDAVIKPFSNALVSSVGLINFLPAYHGTPFEVDKFKLANIGTGEGAQAYGWGLYFAQARKTGEKYRNDLSGYDELTIFTDKGKKKGQQLDDLDMEAAKYLESGARTAGQFKHNTVYYAKQAAERDGKQDVVARIDEYGRDAKVTYEKNLGNLYKVDIDVKDEDLLDWDKPLSEQSKKVQKALAEMNADYRSDSDEYDSNEQGQITYSRLGNPQEASKALLTAGIPGIRYFDGTSRKQGQGTYNYVVFDENLITILDKNDKPVQDELPRATGLQFLPAEGAKKGKTTKKEKGKKKEPQKQYITVDSGDDETVPVLQEIRDGKPLTDPKGDAKFVQQKYNLLSSPFIDNYSGEKPEDTTKPNYDQLAYDVSGVAQKKINAAIDSGAVDAVANIMVNKTNEAMKNADIAAGSGWYSRMRENLLNALGVEGRELLSQLLGATSAKTPVNENFLQAMDGYEGIKSGRYDSNRKAYLEMMDAESKNELNDLIDNRNYIAVIKNKISDLNKASKKVTGKKQKVIQSEVKKLKDLIAIKPEDRTKKNRFSIVINASGLMPLRSNGKKFNANSMAVMKVIAGTWLDNRKAPKTPNFAGNLSGRTVQATIDVWAARFMRQILHEGFGTPWRIQPKSETGVTNEDFALGQVIMQRAAKKLGMNPDDLQAILWFAEKHNWDDRGWTGSEGAEKSSFDEIFSVFFPKGKKPLTFLEASEVLKSQKNKDETMDEDIDEDIDEDDGE